MSDTTTIEDYHGSDSYLLGAKAFDQGTECPYPKQAGFDRIAWWHGYYDMKHHTNMSQHFEHPTKIHLAAKGEPQA